MLVVSLSQRPRPQVPAPLVAVNFVAGSSEEGCLLHRLRVLARVLSGAVATAVTSAAVNALPLLAGWSEVT